jgi:hypothetical protein
VVPDPFLQICCGTYGQTNFPNFSLESIKEKSGNGQECFRKNLSVTLRTKSHLLEG